MRLTIERIKGWKIWREKKSYINELKWFRLEKTEEVEASCEAKKEEYMNLIICCSSSRRYKYKDKEEEMVMVSDIEK